MTNQFYKKYFKILQKNIADVDYGKLEKISKLIKKLNKNNKLIFVGNGGSASISSHCATDFVKIAKKRAITFNDANLITCFANDYGHENWMKEALKVHGLKGDILILISSSGNSKNILNCAKVAKKLGISIVTFSGFKKNNKLKSYGQINMWVNSTSYNHIEMAHHIWLVSICDFLSNYKK